MGPRVALVAAVLWAWRRFFFLKGSLSSLAAARRPLSPRPPVHCCWRLSPSPLSRLAASPRPAADPVPRPWCAGAFPRPAVASHPCPLPRPPARWWRCVLAR